VTSVTRILLKARPTLAQLRDRLAAPAPEGIELYLDRTDLLRTDWLESMHSAVADAAAPTDFVWIVEAPTRTLDGEFFDLSRDDPDARETLRRVVEVGSAIGAVAANVHVVAPTRDASRLNEAERAARLEQAASLLSYYVDACESGGLVAQIENVPPVGRMREGAFVFSSIGAAPDDLRELAEGFPAVRFTLDVSHAALYLNWRRVAPEELAPDLRQLALFCRARSGPVNLPAFARLLADRTTSVHVSNARGILGEGLGYDEGDEDLDAALAPLSGRVPYFITETLEADDDRASGMRDAQEHLARLRAARATGART
jgi:sugar phosphate isomerase/epimerase